MSADAAALLSLGAGTPSLRTPDTPCPGVRGSLTVFRSRYSMTAWVKNSRPPSSDDQPLHEQEEAVLVERSLHVGPPLPQLHGGCDQLDGAEGEFGHDAANPIPVNGHGGAGCYLERLRDERGEPPLYHRIESIAHGGRQLEVYELYWCGSSSPRSRLHFHVHHVRRSVLAPKGCSLQAWSSLPTEARHALALQPRGSRQRIHEFPFRLPEVVHDRVYAATGDKERARQFEMALRRHLSLEGGRD